MATVTITLTDNDDMNVDVKVEFGDEGAQDDSNAHHMAIAMVGRAVKAATAEDGNE